MATGLERQGLDGAGGLRRRVAVFLTGAIVLLASVQIANVNATDSFRFSRFSGVNRYDTARLVAQATFGTNDLVVLATGEDFPDALAATYVAGIGLAPILLARRAALPEASAEALRSLQARRVEIVGGADAIGREVEDELRRRGYEVSRVGGATRYETAQAAAESGGTEAVGTVEQVRTAVVATGEDFADALAAGPISYAQRLPTLLTARAALSPEARGALQRLRIGQILLPGGEEAVTANVQSEIRAMGITVRRFPGRDRTETAALLADYALSQLRFSPATVNLARGDGFVDALAGASSAGRERAPMLLSASSTELGDRLRGWLHAHAGALEAGRIFGGEAAVSRSVEDDATAAARASARGASTSTTGGSTTTTTDTTGASTTTSTARPGASTTTTSPTTTPTSGCPPGTGPGPPPLCLPVAPLPV